MGVQVIPTGTDAFYSQVTDLEGSDYLLEFQYNQRENAWYLSVSLSDATPIASGIKVVCYQDLLQGVADARKPPGVIIALPVTLDDSPPGFSELGGRVVLNYWTSDSFV